jgi:transcriptional regulator with XRE-family HTH domain
MKRELKPTSKPASKPALKKKSKRKPNPRWQRELDEEVVALCSEMRRLREQRYMTLEYLGGLADLTPNYIGTVENGRRDPSLTTLQALADGLNMPLAELFGPPIPLSREALEMARMFNEVPDDLKTSLLQTLQAVLDLQQR